MTRAEILERIEEFGIIPAVLVSSEAAALFASEAVLHSGIRIVEITMTIECALDVISRLSHAIGAGTVLDPNMAPRCLDAGAWMSLARSRSASRSRVLYATKVVAFKGVLQLGSRRYLVFFEGVGSGGSFLIAMPPKPALKTICWVAGLPAE